MNPTHLKALVRRWALPVAALAVVGAALAYLVSKHVTPVYDAKGSVLVIAGPNQSVGASSLNINATEATTTAATLITEPSVLQQVIDDLHLRTTPADLAKQVTATPQSNTELVDVVVRDESASVAAQIANAVMTTYVAQVTDQNSQRTDQAGAALQAQITQVQQTIGQEQRDLAAAPQNGVDATALRATISSNTALLSQLTLNYSSFKASQTQDLETVSVAAAASAPITPASPRVSLNTLLGGIAGLVVGLILATALQFLDQGLHSAADVVERLKLPCLGVIPRYRTSRIVGKKSTAREKRNADAASEAYRRLRTNLLFSSPDTDLRSVVLTSARSGEGKTCTAANLAVALANSEKRVLLIDADMRRPDQHRLFGKTLVGGMSEMILKTSPYSIPALNGVHRTQFDNLSLLTSGMVPPNPSELLASRRAHLLIHTLGASQDILVIDTPPVGVVTDGLSLAAEASATVLVVEAGRTNAAQAADVIESLRAVGATVVGVVLNKARRSAAGGYYYQYDATSSSKTQTAALNFSPTRAEGASTQTD